MYLHPNRRSFLAWATAGLGAVFTAILGEPELDGVAGLVRPGELGREAGALLLGAVEQKLRPFPRGPGQGPRKRPGQAGRAEGGERTERGGGRELDHRGNLPRPTTVRGGSDIGSRPASDRRGFSTGKRLPQKPRSASRTRSSSSA